jgi:hypothetical protein
MVVVLNFTKTGITVFFALNHGCRVKFHKKCNFCYFRVTYGRQVKFHGKKRILVFCAKSSTSGQISRKNVISVSFRINHGRWDKFQQKKRDFGFFFRVNHGCRVKFHEKIGILIRAKSWPSGQISRKNVIWIFST